MNDDVIEAATHAAWKASPELMNPSDVRRMVDAAITAADQARAEAGYALVKRDDLRFVLDEFGWREFRYGTLGIEDAHARLTAALNDGENVTEGD